MRTDTLSATAGKASPAGADYYKAFEDAGYKVVKNKTELVAADDS
jgi:hypothetical protein